MRAGAGNGGCELGDAAWGGIDDGTKLAPCVTAAVTAGQACFGPSTIKFNDQDGRHRDAALNPQITHPCGSQARPTEARLELLLFSPSAGIQATAGVGAGARGSGCARGALHRAHPSLATITFTRAGGLGKGSAA